MPTLSRRAWAKVNLALSVGPPQPPGSPNAGWHPICTWMHAIDLADEVKVEKSAAQSRYEVTWSPDAPRPSPIDWPIDQDLAVRAHRFLEAHADRPLPIRLRLTKRIPVGGGLGGGSADAAAALLAINTLFNLGHSLDGLRTFSRRLGSDVAFFIDEQDPALPAIVSGFGDRIDRLPSRRADWLVLLLPTFGCPTHAVYLAYDGPPRSLRPEAVQALAAAHDDHAPGPLFNDLDAPATTVAPALAPLRAALATALARPIHMTGSGSTLFTLADSESGARALAAKAASVPGITPVPTRLV